MEYCRIPAEKAQEPLIGTAQRNDFHFMLSIPKTEWGPRVEEMEGIAGALGRIIAPLKGQAVLSLKNDGPEERGVIHVFPNMLRFENVPPEEYGDLVEGVLTGHITHPYTKIEAEQVVLICTHGKRDACCAKYGGQTLEALRASVPDGVEVWESSHLGGHRFAGTLVVQPLNHWYGWLDPDDVPDFWERLRGERVLTRCYRGNANLPPPLQAAEGWAWAQLEAEGGEPFLLDPHIEGTCGRVRVLLATSKGERTYDLQLEGTSYTFLANTGNDVTKDRLIWQVERHAAS